MRRASICVITLLLASTAVRADDQPAAPKLAPRKAKAAPVSAMPRRPVRSIPRAARTVAGAKPDGEAYATGLLSPLDPPKAGASKRSGEPSSWSIAPKWSASNGGGYAAYGTRALINEMQLNPAETNGYGAGAKLDFHF